jgi:hypothetical protein
MVARQNFQRIISFSTWSHTVSNTVKESTLDHIYCNHQTLVKNCDLIKPILGDHVLTFIEIYETKPAINRDWKNYSTTVLNEILTQVYIYFDNDSVQ